MTDTNTTTKPGVLNEESIRQLVFLAARLCEAVEFRIDDPRSHLLDSLRRAITTATGCNCPAVARAEYISHAPNCPTRAALSRVQGGAA